MVPRTLPLALAILLVLLPAGAAADTTTSIIVKREPGLNAAERAEIRTDADVEYVRSLSLPRTEVVAADAGQVGEALDVLRADENVEFAEVDHRRRAFADPFMNQLWGLRNVGQAIPGDVAGFDDADSDVVEAWGLLTNPGENQEIAVVDTGVVNGHEDLSGRVPIRRNFIGTNNGEPGASDGNGHGTHVIGTIVANQDNDIGVAGVAPDATVLALKALGNDGSGYDSDIAEAFEYGAANARIVNASLGGPDGGELLRSVIAAHPNTLFVVAAGNGGSDGVGDNNDAAPQYPCNVPEPNVLCVGASTNRDLRGSFSNYGRFTVDLFAPGQSILSTYPMPGTDPDYAFLSGTSMASPHVAGAAALVMQRASSLSAEEVKQVLLTWADDKPAFASTSLSGGRLNVRAAVEKARNAGDLPDQDGDGIVDAADACRMSAASGSADGCPDTDEDAVPNSSDNCPTVKNPGQQNSDGRADGGDACDRDFDNDGRPNTSDSCPTVYALTANGCPAPPPPPNRDRDGRIDAIDACPTEYALTKDGCPLPALTGVSRKVKRRAVVVKASTSRGAKVRILVQRKKGRKWVKVKKRTLTTHTNRVKLTVRRLKRGRHRIVVAVYSNAGLGGSAKRYFKVR